MKVIGGRVFGWGLALLLILACAPVAVAPVSTLDANSISTLIVQTGVAAGTQTAQAQPFVAPTSTFAPTFTPEPTFTAIPVIDLPTPIPAQTTQYFRVLHDHQLALYGFRSRTGDPSWPVDSWGLQTTEVVPLFVEPKPSAGTHRTTISGVWAELLNALNFYNAKKLHYIKADNTALFNGAGFPQMESLTMGGNIITLVEIKNGWGRVRTFDYGNPGSVENITYFTKPDLVHKFVVVGWNRDRKVTYHTKPPPTYGDLYWPLVSSRAVWIPMERLEAFPLLPLKVTAIKSQPIREKPALDGRETPADFSEGESATVVEYFPAGSYVWGRLASGGWISLLTYEKGALLYPTDWKMNTIPPLP